MVYRLRSNRNGISSRASNPPAKSPTAAGSGTTWALNVPPFVGLEKLTKSPESDTGGADVSCTPKPSETATLDVGTPLKKFARAEVLAPWRSETSVLSVAVAELANAVSKLSPELMMFVELLNKVEIPVLLLALVYTPMNPRNPPIRELVPKSEKVTDPVLDVLAARETGPAKSLNGEYVTCTLDEEVFV